MSKQKKYANIWPLLFLILILIFPLSSQDKNAEKNSGLLGDISLSALKFRGIGPALTSGRISDFAVNPENKSEYFVASSSGGVWKTTNAGTTFTPVFDNEGSYSIGCVTMDPNNHNVVWVGTGENNSQRSVGYGDGIYKSVDGAGTWMPTHGTDGTMMGRHVTALTVDPEDAA